MPVEEIMELRLGLNIISMPGLRRYFNIDGYVSKSLCDISANLASRINRPAPGFLGEGPRVRACMAGS